MQTLRRYLTVGSLAAGMAILAACGASPTATTAPVAATTAPVAATTASGTARPSTAPTAAASAGASTAPATAARTTTAATTSGTATTASPTTAAATATRAGSPVAGSPVAGTPTRTGSATPGAGGPAQAYATLQSQPSSRQSWVFSGFSVGGLSGDLRPVFDYNGGNQKVAITAGGIPIEAYQVGGTLYVPNPLGGYTAADGSNPFGAPAQALFATPATIVGTLAPASATYTAAGTETINGRQATRYTASVTLADLGVVNPSLAGQRGTAATIVWVDTAQGYLVALDSTIRADQATATTATARLDVTNVGQVPAIAVPR